MKYKNKNIQISCDGGAATGKSTGAKMIARKYNIPNSYELLKDASRGKKISKTELYNIISKLNIPEHEKDKLFGLTPTKYIGLSSKLCNGQ